ncbi:MAG: hypothetical protein QNL45_03535 [Nitrospirota bacterium]|nr:hypothetical protein [Nitrospirota bacterium]
MSFLIIRELMVELDSITNKFGKNTVTLVAGCWLVHAAQSANPELN